MSVQQESPRAVQGKSTEEKIAEYLHQMGCRAEAMQYGSTIRVRITNRDMRLEPVQEYVRTAEFDAGVRRYVQACYGTARNLNPGGVAKELVALCEREKEQVTVLPPSASTPPLTKFRPVRGK